MRLQLTLAVLLAAVFAVAAASGGCTRDSTDAQDLPITVTDSGVRVTLALLEESDNLLALTFKVVSERSESETAQAAIELGGVAVQSDLRYVSLTYDEDALIDDGTATGSEAPTAIEVMVEKPADPSRAVSFAFTQVLVASSPGDTPMSVAGHWEFQFVPRVA